MPEGRQSPPPEQQAGKQGTDAPSSGKGVNDSNDNKQDSKNQLEGLESNPKSVMDDAAREKVSKTVNNTS